MNNVVIKVSDDILHKMQQFYKDNILPKTPNHALFSAKVNNITITAYKSNKVMFQGKDCDQEASMWGIFESKNKKDKSINNINLYNTSSVGSDEVGTGDYFGPIVVCASYVSKDDIKYLESLGIKDSKKLNDTKIKSIAEKVMEKIPYHVSILNNIKYNELQENGMNQNMMKAKLHNHCLLNVINKIDIKPENIIVDQFTPEKNYYNYLKDDNNVLKGIYFSTNGESVHLSVAASSIIARYVFLNEMDKLSDKVGFILPKGAGKPVDEVLPKINENDLKSIAKVHFANTNKRRTK